MQYLIAGLIIIGLIVLLVQWIVQFVTANLIAIVAIAVFASGMFAIVKVTKHLLHKPLALEEDHTMEEPAMIDNESLRLLHRALEHNRKLHDVQ